MRFERLGKSVKGFAIAPQRERFGVMCGPADPVNLKEWMGGREFSWTKRYLYTIPLYIFYTDTVDEDARPAVKGRDVKGKPDEIRGDVFICGRKGDDVAAGLSDLEASIIMQNVTIEKTDGVTHARLNNVSLKPGPMPPEMLVCDEPPLDEDVCEDVWCGL